MLHTLHAPSIDIIMKQYKMMIKKHGYQIDSNSTKINNFFFVKEIKTYKQKNKINW